jgi:aminoglycoside phosphotransferase (APT) family kinase protein
VSRSDKEFQNLPLELFVFSFLSADQRGHSCSLPRHAVSLELPASAKTPKAPQGIKLMQQSNFTQNEILHHLRQAFGNQCNIVAVSQFRGGTRKQVYFIDLIGPVRRCVLYIWHDLNRYFGDIEESDSAHTDANAPTMFKINSEYLLNRGITVPQIYHMGKLEVGHDFALLEYVDGGNFTEFAKSATADEQDSVLRQVALMLRKLNYTQRAYPGTLLDTSSPYPASCSKMALDNALLELVSASATHVNVAEHKERIAHRLHELHAHLAPSNSYRLIHGELGPEHILIRKAGQKVYFVDIEGVHFFDAEVEHALMKYRFGDDIYSHYFKHDDLDLDRMEFYRLAQHVSFVYAGTRFILGAFHDQAWAQLLFTSNLARVLKIVDSPLTF